MLGEFPGGGRANTESVDTLMISNWSAGDSLGFSLLGSKVKVQTQLCPTINNTQQNNKGYANVANPPIARARVSVVTGPLIGSALMYPYRMR